MSALIFFGIVATVVVVLVLRFLVVQVLRLIPAPAPAPEGETPSEGWWQEFIQEVKRSFANWKKAEQQRAESKHLRTLPATGPVVFLATFLAVLLAMIAHDLVKLFLLPWLSLLLGFSLFAAS